MTRLFNLSPSQISILAAALWVALASLPAFAQERQGFTDPAQIDALVETFTGKSAGTIGGARRLVDPRLRLRRCDQPLKLGWHGQPGRNIAVDCPDATGWRIYVAVRPAPQQSVSQKAAIKRGEAVTIAVRGRGFSVQRSGEALSGGTIGEWISVRADRRGETLRAQIKRPGLVVIPVR